MKYLIAATLACFLLSGHSPYNTRHVHDPAQGRQGIPDVSDIVGSLGLQRLESLLPVFFTDISLEGREESRDWQILLLEARAFWRNMLGALPDGGLMLVDSSVWIALRPDLQYGFPGTGVQTREDGLLTLLANEETSGFDEAAAELFRIAPISLRGPLLAQDLATVEGAGKYAEAWAWVVFGESLAEGLRIGARFWWQRRLVGAVAAWMFLESPRGMELVPGSAVALDAWGWFFREYYKRIALPLDATHYTPPQGEQYEVLELDARLLAMGKDIWQRYGSTSFSLMRTAWPHDSPSVAMQEILDALWGQMPDIRPWEERLLNPRGEQGVLVP